MKDLIKNKASDLAVPESQRLGGSLIPSPSALSM